MKPTPSSVPPAARRVIGRIHAEHLALARVIGAMQAWVSRARDPAQPMDGPLFAAMLRYVAEVPDRLHHPQEDRHLFPALRALPEAAAIVERLEREHAAGAERLDAVAAAFAAARRQEANALNCLATAVDEFAEFYWSHMRTEEDALLPLALAALPEKDWMRIDDAFEAVQDPLFASEPALEYRDLYRFIAARSPGPLRGYLEEAARPRA